METTEAATGSCLPLSPNFSVFLFYIIEHNEVLLHTIDYAFHNIKCHGN